MTTTAAHDAFESRLEEDGWHAYCKSCDWRGPARPHVLDTGADATGHRIHQDLVGAAVAAGAPWAT